MIGKGGTGGGFAGCDQYLRKDKVGKELGKKVSKEIGRSTIVSKSEDQKGIYKEIGAVRKLKPNLKKAVFHASLSLKPGTKLDESTWSNIGHDYMKKMGFTDNQYLIYRHSDTDKDHIHIVANRVKLDGSVVSDSYSRKRTMDVVRGLELKYGLEVVKTDYNKTITSAEYKEYDLTGKAPLKVELQKTLARITKDKPTMSNFLNRLQTEKIYAKFRIDKNGNASGLTYIKGTEKIKASDVGKAYTFSGLQNRKGVNYEKHRDDPQISRSTELARGYEQNIDGRRIAETNAIDVRANRENGLSDEIVNSRDRVISSEVDRESLRSGERDKKSVHEGHTGSIDNKLNLDKGMDSDQREIGEKAVEVRRDTEKIPAFLGEQDWVHGEKVVSKTVAESRVDFSDVNDRISNSVGNIQDFREMESKYYREQGQAVHEMGISGDKSPNGRGRKEDNTEVSRPIEKGRIYNQKKEFKDQITALGPKKYEVVLMNVRTGKHKVDVMTDKELLKNYDKLKVENIKGYNIAIRPKEQNNFVVVNGVNEKNLNKMKEDGLTPSVVIESKGKQQAWICLSKKDVPDNLKDIAQTEVENRYRGLSYKTSDYIPVAGFKEHTQKDLKPSARLIEGVKKVAENGKRLIDNITYKLGLQKYERRHNRRIENIRKYVDPQKEAYSQTEYYKIKFKEFFGDNKSLKEIEKADFSSHVDVFKKQEHLRDRIFNLGTTEGIVKEINIKDYHAKLKKIDLDIAKDMYKQEVAPELIMSTLRDNSPAFASENIKLENSINKAFEKMDHAMDLSRGPGFLM